MLYFNEIYIKTLVDQKKLPRQRRLPSNPNHVYVSGINVITIMAMIAITITRESSMG